MAAKTESGVQIEPSLSKYFKLVRGTSRLSALMQTASGARSPHETASEGKVLKSIFDYNRNRKQTSPELVEG
jgi:hypothetical protein